MSYCEKSIVKDRMLIAQNDTSYDEALDTAINEASRMVDIFLKPYTEVPLNDTDAQIAQITGDFSASIFKRRMVPNEVTIRGPLKPNPMDIVSEVDASGWFAIGIRKLELYIKAFYTLEQEIGNTVHNPDIWVNLFDKGLITGLEARAGINDATIIATKRIDELTKVLATQETITREETLTKTETRVVNDTVSEYKTKRQNSFAFIQGKEGSKEYEEQEE